MELFLKIFLIQGIILPVIMASVIQPSDKSIGEWQPQQIHIALGEEENEMVITWVTKSRTNTSTVHFGPSWNLEFQKDGFSKRFQDGGRQHRTMWIHRVHLRNLTENTNYVYRCGSWKGWSELFRFKTMKAGSDWPVTVAMYGDLGLKNPQSLSRLQLETENGMYNAIIHVGDFAYNMDSKNAEVGDAFMNNIQPIAAYVPYMVCPGNHEQKYNFSNYKARFSMPLYEQTENLFYSWNVGPVHFIAVNTEAYYFMEYGIKILVNLYQWLEADLKKQGCYGNRAYSTWRPTIGDNQGHFCRKEVQLSQSKLVANVVCVYRRINGERCEVKGL